MKKHTFLFFFLFSINGIAQNANDNLKKYWHYRERLVNDFMVVGDCQRCSLPASQRALSDGTSMKWGDATIMLGYYMGVLGTEYKLLKDNGMNTEQTRMELYYALQAFNRVDYRAESMLTF